MLHQRIADTANGTFSENLRILARQRRKRQHQRNQLVADLVFWVDRRRREIKHMSKLHSRNKKPLPYQRIGKTAVRQRPEPGGYSRVNLVVNKSLLQISLAHFSHNLGMAQDKVE